MNVCSGREVAVSLLKEVSLEFASCLHLDPLKINTSQLLKPDICDYNLVLKLEY